MSSRNILIPFSILKVRNALTSQNWTMKWQQMKCTEKYEKKTQKTKNKKQEISHRLKYGFFKAHHKNMTLIIAEMIDTSHYEWMNGFYFRQYDKVGNYKIVLGITKWCMPEDRVWKDTDVCTRSEALGGKEKKKRNEERRKQKQRPKKKREKTGEVYCFDKYIMIQLKKVDSHCAFEKFWRCRCIHLLVSNLMSSFWGRIFGAWNNGVVCALYWAWCAKRMAFFWAVRSGLCTEGEAVPHSKQPYARWEWISACADSTCLYGKPDPLLFLKRTTRY